MRIATAEARRLPLRASSERQEARRSHWRASPLQAPRSRIRRPASPQRAIRPLEPLHGGKQVETHQRSKNTGQAPLSAGSRIATHSTCDVIGKIWVRDCYEKGQVKAGFSARCVARRRPERQTSVTVDRPVMLRVRRPGRGGLGRPGRPPRRTRKPPSSCATGETRPGSARDLNLSLRPLFALPLGTSGHCRPPRLAGRKAARNSRPCPTGPSLASPTAGAPCRPPRLRCADRDQADDFACRRSMGHAAGPVPAWA